MPRLLHRFILQPVCFCSFPVLHSFPSETRLFCRHLTARSALPPASFFSVGVGRAVAAKAGGGRVLSRRRFWASICTRGGEMCVLFVPEVGRYASYL